jgi:hypothetical protein
MERLPYRYASGLDLDEVTARAMGAAVVRWFEQRTDGRSWFICGAGAHGEVLMATLVTAGEDAHILIGPASLDEMLRRH